MLYINLIEDSNLQDTLNQMISGLLPTAYYESEYHTDILTSIFKYLPLDEMSGEYYILFALLVEVNRITLQLRKTKNLISRDTVEYSLNTNIFELVRKEQVRAKEIMMFEGHSFNVDIETDLLKACKILSRRTLNLYDICFNLRRKSSEVLSFLPVLRDAVVMNVAEHSLQFQSTILNSELRLSKLVFKGAIGWLNYIKHQQAVLTERIENAESGLMVIDSLDKSEELLSTLETLYIPLASYDLPPMDESTPMLRHRLTVICANENVGKTKISTNCVGNLLIAGNRVVIMCGENTMPLVYASVLSNYIYKKHGLRISAEMVAKRNSLPEDKKKLVNLTSAELSSSGKLILKDSFSYNNFYDEVVTIYDKTPFDALIIDHSMALLGTGNDTENITNLAKQAREFKKAYPVYVQILSHLSVTAKDAISKGKVVDNSPTKSSSVLSAEADDIMLLIDNPILAKQNLLAIYNYKRRGAQRILENMIVRKKFDVSSYYYDPALQNSIDGIDLTAEQVLQDIDELHKVDDVSDDDDFDDENIEWLDDEDEDYEDDM